MYTVHIVLRILFVFPPSDTFEWFLSGHPDSVFYIRSTLLSQGPVNVCLHHIKSLSLTPFLPWPFTLTAHSCHHTDTFQHRDCFWVPRSICYWSENLNKSLHWRTQTLTFFEGLAKTNNYQSWNTPQQFRNRKHIIYCMISFRTKTTNLVLIWRMCDGSTIQRRLHDWHQQTPLSQ